ncbi:hypothetical protein [Chengkuizengella axinellae]|uniref:Small, acid-soluble spore protein gamma-type n=1 Tax=Chengkuizengella axinellae TaxID=3064388 RepID=A0ABT9J0S4_9BACL|nr:hypothetical protein [Chengkuizengella sp. 2205SS18-9]MDP5275178.1 hypothetical protein [Chengkuizengella sp. 2205SS18-9]
MAKNRNNKNNPNNQNNQQYNAEFAEEVTAKNTKRAGQNARNQEANK